jgi:hypothetical protein
MEYVVRSVPIILVGALVIYLILLLVEWRKPEEKVLCTLATKKEETEFDRIAVKRREHTLYSLIFQTEQGQKIEVRVSQDVYRLIPKGESGTLCHKGNLFRWFSNGAETIHYYSLLEEENQGKLEEQV